MLNTFTISLSQTIRIFLFIAVGYLLSKARILPQSSGNVLSKLSILLLNPMLTIYTFSEQCTPENFRENTAQILYGTAMFGLAVVTAHLLTPLFSKEKKSQGVYRYALGIPNTGTFRVPIVLALFGSEGYFIGSLYNIAATIITYTWGILQFKSSPKNGKIAFFLKKMLNVNTIALFVGAFLGLTGTARYIPDIVMEDIELLGNAFVPLAMLSLGMFVADYRMNELVPSGRTLVFTGWRMILLPILMVLLLKAVKAPDFAIILTALSFSCPCGMYAVLFPAANGDSTQIGVNIMVFSSIASVIIIPFIYAFTCSLL